MKSKKILAALLALLLLLFAGCNNAPAEPDEQPDDNNNGGDTIEDTTTPRLEVEFTFTQQDGYSTNQFAIWVADAAGNYVTTLYATSFTAGGGYTERENALKNWVAAANPAELDDDQISTISGATPDSGTLSYSWDLTDSSGNPVPDGDYIVYLEATLRDENAVVYSAEFTVGGVQSQSEPAASYTGDSEAERGMVSGVVVRYISDVLPDPAEMPTPDAGDTGTMDLPG